MTSMYLRAILDAILGPQKRTSYKMPELPHCPLLIKMGFVLFVVPGYSLILLPLSCGIQKQPVGPWPVAEGAGLQRAGVERGRWGLWDYGVCGSVPVLVEAACPDLLPPMSRQADSALLGLNAEITGPHKSPSSSATYWVVLTPIHMHMDILWYWQ